jgi:hypothetical protein
MLKKTVVPQGPMETAQYHSPWEPLKLKLSECGIHDDELQKARESLDANGSATITEVVLSDEQLTQLGFVVLAA